MGKPTGDLVASPKWLERRTERFFITVFQRPQERYQPETCITPRFFFFMTNPLKIKNAMHVIKLT
jgi:hypothetical protein